MGLNLDFVLKAGIWALGLGLYFEVGIKAVRLGFGLCNLDLSLEARIWASRLEFGP